MLRSNDLSKPLLSRGGPPSLEPHSTAKHFGGGNEGKNHVGGCRLFTYEIDVKLPRILARVTKFHGRKAKERKGVV